MLCRAGQPLDDAGRAGLRRVPRRNRAYWMAKLDSNARRDRLTDRQLRAMGLQVLHLWEHQLHDLGRCVRRVARALR